MTVVIDKIFLQNPDIKVVCVTEHTTLSAVALTYEIECVRCEEGTHWDEGCQDCVPICFPDMLAMLQIINANLPAKIIG